MHTSWMSGAGNLFLTVDGFTGDVPADPSAFARDACRRTAPNGRRPDGVILVKRPRAGGDCSMEIYNADGSRPETCGNGLRCVAKLVVDRGHVTQPAFVIETDAGSRTARVELENGVVHRATIHMGAPILVARHERLRVAGGEVDTTIVDVGNPHCVLFVDDERSAPVAVLGPELEHHARFPRGTNVEFLALRREGAFLRVWERGVGETQACGSGACAAALAAVDAGRAAWPVELVVPGGRLVVDSDGRGGVTLCGPVEDVTSPSTSSAESLRASNADGALPETAAPRAISSSNANPGRSSDGADRPPPVGGSDRDVRRPLRSDSDRGSRGRARS